MQVVHAPAVHAVVPRVMFDVVGWTPAQSDAHETVARDVHSYAQGAIVAGLEASEIEADILTRWGSLFETVSVEVTRSFRAAKGAILAVAAPVAA